MTLHRLNRAEYNNTVRDLLGTTRRPANDFPADDFGYGFDNNADVLTLPPSLLELYERTAEELIEEAMAIPVAEVVTQSFEAEQLKGEVGAASGEVWNLWSSGELPVVVEFPAAGQYRVAARVWGQQAGPDVAKAELLVAGKSLGVFDVAATEGKPQVIEATTQVPLGKHVVSVSFLNDYYEPTMMLDRNLLIDWIKVEGPLGVSGAKNPAREKIVTCDLKTGEACWKQVIGDFARKAWRRPVSGDEVASLVGLVKLAMAEGDDENEGVKLALRAALVSPHFVFRVELDPDPLSPSPHPLGDHELASRLSYFLWSSMPDDALMAAADGGKLQAPDEIGKQVERMLADPKASSFVENFTGQWLYTRALDAHEPDYDAYPAFDDELREAMREETTRFFRELLDGEHDAHELITADFTFVNARLAKHYGLPAPAGEGFQRVQLSGDRRGVLGHGSLLTVTSLPKRTSPVKRGKWVLTQLLCSAPAPPPPGVEGIEQKKDAKGSMRQILEEHRKNPDCAYCHRSMDPIGFGLEHFDGVGAFRQMDGVFPIDDSGELPDLGTFDGARQMTDLLAKDPSFGKCLTRQLYTYALGRGSTSSDSPYLDDINKQFQAKNSRMKALIAAIAQSEPFRLRRGEPTP